MVRQRLAIANLIPPVLTLFRKDDISAETMRALTLATKAQQKAWLKRFRDPQDYAPHGRQLRQWLLGGEQIATSAALFPLEAYGGAIVTDLFGEEAYFADPDRFWSLQREAVAERGAAYRERGWNDVVVLERGAYWPSYDYQKVAKTKGGRVYVCLSSSGEAAFHEGFLPLRELRKREEADLGGDEEVDTTSVRPELTKAARYYVDLHRHAAVGAALLTEPGTALRLMVAHALAGSALCRVEADPRRTDKEETGASLSKAKATGRLAEEDETVLGILDREEGGPLIARFGGDLESVFRTLLALEDEAVMRVLTLVMARSLAVGSGTIDTLGKLLSVGMDQWWEADDAFLGLIRDWATLFALLEEVGGEAVAAAHVKSPAKLLRSILRQYATGEGREKAEGWVPRFLRFPAESYQQTA